MGDASIRRRRATRTTSTSTRQCRARRAGSGTGATTDANAWIGSRQTTWSPPCAPYSALRKLHPADSGLHETDAVVAIDRQHGIALLPQLVDEFRHAHVRAPAGRLCDLPERVVEHDDAEVAHEGGEQIPVAP